MIINHHFHQSLRAKNETGFQQKMDLKKHLND